VTTDGGGCGVSAATLAAATPRGDADDGFTCPMPEEADTEPA